MCCLHRTLRFHCLPHILTHQVGLLLGSRFFQLLLNSYLHSLQLSVDLHCRYFHQHFPYINPFQGNLHLYDIYLQQLMDQHISGLPVHF